MTRRRSEPCPRGNFRCNSSLLALLVILAALPAAAADDLLLLHGHVYTGSSRMPWAEAIAVHQGRITAIGTDRAVARAGPKGAAVLDLHGRTVIPGIVDAHVHMLFGAYALHGLNLTTPERSVTAANPGELVARLRAYAGAHPQDPVILGRADFSATPPSTPGKELLDQAVPDRPVVLHNSSEHSLWVNSAALRLAGIGEFPLADPQEERGVIRDASGHPRGVLLEAAMEAMERAVDRQLPEESKLAMLEVASNYLSSLGITSVVNATGSLAELRLYATLRDRGKLTVRTRTAIGAVSVAHQLTPEFLAGLESARANYHDEWVSANLVKFFADGFSGLIPPLVYEPHSYDALVSELDRRGFQIMTHAARDDSVHMILDAYQRAIERNGPRDRRLRIEHADVTDAADLERFAALGVAVVMEPSFCCAQTGLNYDLEHALPTDRWRGFLDQWHHPRLRQRLALHGATRSFSRHATGGNARCMAIGGHRVDCGQSLRWGRTGRRAPHRCRVCACGAHHDRGSGAGLHLGIRLRGVHGRSGGHAGNRQAGGSGGAVPGSVCRAAGVNRGYACGDDHGRWPGRVRRAPVAISAASV